jgi:hypothetical protein
MSFQSALKPFTGSRWWGIKQRMQALFASFSVGVSFRSCDSDGLAAKELRSGISGDVQFPFFVIAESHLYAIHCVNYV